MNKLYRGVSKDLDEKNSCQIIPNGTQREVTMRFGDPGVRFDGKFVFGSSEINTARSHQVDSAMHDGCGISTSRDIEVARHFATSGNLEDGVIYVINEDRLEKYSVNVYEFDDSENSHENEVTLITSDCTPLPEELIVERINVKSDNT